MIRFNPIDSIVEFWHRFKSLMLWLALAATIYLFVAGQSGFVRIYKLQRLNNQLKAEIHQRQTRRDWLVKERDRLLNDPARIEREARETYGMARPDEIVLKMR
ncbi:MAG TPA: septum formation initiator family protein [bacterium]|jgi:cell division protein FtsB|nr:septum formation initiator family protein [bacterium]HNT66669.1 septum formation initiator family protein [bacterium]HOX87223.1 septum formation initiator family protein [bacterium]HPG46684.1 septum formation initiator family protein [bacterium]HPM98784.1 septum formation initiator family protein [bacterium]